MSDFATQAQNIADQVVAATTARLGQSVVLDEAQKGLLLRAAARIATSRLSRIGVTGDELERLAWQEQAALATIGNIEAANAEQLRQTFIEVMNIVLQGAVQAAIGGLVGGVPGAVAGAVTGTLNAVRAPAEEPTTIQLNETDDREFTPNG